MNKRIFRDDLSISTVADYLLIVASAAFAGFGVSNFWVGVSVLFGLIALYKPSH